MNTHQCNQANWYTDEDKEIFNQVMIRDVVRCSIMLESRADRMLTPIEQSRCIGLDKLISRNPSERYQEIKAARKAHVDAVIDAQRMARPLNIDPSVLIACVSEASSRKSCDRAHKVAMLSRLIED